MIIHIHIVITLFISYSSLPLDNVSFLSFIPSKSINLNVTLDDTFVVVTDDDS